jgi:hypothetical protein
VTCMHHLCAADVLRRQVKVPKRKACRPKLSRLDKLFLAAASRVLWVRAGPSSCVPGRRRALGEDGPLGDPSLDADPRSKAS